MNPASVRFVPGSAVCKAPGVTGRTPDVIPVTKMSPVPSTANPPIPTWLQNGASALTGT